MTDTLPECDACNSAEQQFNISADSIDWWQWRLTETVNDIAENFGEAILQQQLNDDALTTDQL